MQQTVHDEAGADGRGAKTAGEVASGLLQSASVVLPGLRSRRDGAGGHQGLEVAPNLPGVHAARGRSTELLSNSVSPIPPSVGERAGRVLPAAQATQVTPSAREAGGKEERVK